MANQNGPYDEEATSVPTDDPETKRQASSLVRKLKQLGLAAWSDIKTITTSSYLNYLFVFVPAGFACRYALDDPVVTFAVNFIAIVPASALLGFALKDIQERLQQEVLSALIYIVLG